MQPKALANASCQRLSVGPKILYQTPNRRSTSALPYVCQGKTQAGPQTEAAPEYARYDGELKMQPFCTTIGNSRRARNLLPTLLIFFFGKHMEKNVPTICWFPVKKTWLTSSGHAHKIFSGAWCKKIAYQTNIVICFLLFSVRSQLVSFHPGSTWGPWFQMTELVAYHQLEKIL